MNGFLSIVRGCQDVMGMLVLGGVFERHPDLQVVCVEADAGWVPHYMYRMDHAYKRHRNWLPAGRSCRSCRREYFAENIYVTFQDDWTAFAHADDMNWRPAHVGQRLPPLRLDLAVVARRCSPSTPPTSPTEQKQAHPVRQRRRALRHRSVEP